MSRISKLIRASCLVFILGGLSFSVYANVYLTNTVLRDGIAYFLSSDGGIIYRYDTDSNQHLESWEFEGPISAFEIANDRLYYSISQSVYERPLTSDRSIEFATFSETVETFVISGEYLVATLDRRIVNIDLVERTQLSSLPISCTTPVYNKKHKTTYCLDANNGTLTSVIFNNDGIMSEKSESENGAAMYYKGLYNMPGNEDLVLSGSGNLFNAESLEYEATLSEPFESLAYDNQNIYTLSLEKVYRFERSMRPSGQIDIPRLGNVRLSNLNQNTIAYRNGTLYIFLHDYSNQMALTVSDGEFTEVVPAQLNALHPNLDRIEHAKSKDGSLIYLHSNDSNSIHRWDVNSKRYLPSINFDTIVNTISYDYIQDLLYAGLRDGRILKISPDLSTAYINRTPYFINSIMAMSGKIYVQDHAFGISHYSFDFQGNLYGMYANAHTADITGNRFITSNGDNVFQMRDYGDYTVSIFDNSGRYIDYIRGRFNRTDADVRLVSYNEADDLVLLTDGGIYNYLTGRGTASLEKTIDKGVWFGDTLLTSRIENNKTLVELWGNDYQRLETIELLDKIEEIIPINEGEALFVLNSGTTSHIELYTLEKLRQSANNNDSLCNDTCSALQSYFEGVESLVAWSGINNITSLDMEIANTSNQPFSASTISAGGTAFDVSLTIANGRNLVFGFTESQILLKKADSIYSTLEFENAVLFDLEGKQETNHQEISYQITNKQTGDRYNSWVEFSASVRGIFEINTNTGRTECLLIEYSIPVSYASDSFSGRVCITKDEVLALVSNPFNTNSRRWSKPGEEYTLMKANQGSPRTNGGTSSSGGSLSFIFLITAMLFAFYKQPNVAKP